MVAGPGFSKWPTVSSMKAESMSVVLDSAIERTFVDALAAMSWENPKHRPVLEAEGLRKWLAADTSGYDSLRDAARAQGFFGTTR